MRQFPGFSWKTRSTCETYRVGTVAMLLFTGILRYKQLEWNKVNWFSNWNRQRIAVRTQECCWHPMQSNCQFTKGGALNFASAELYGKTKNCWSDEVVLRQKFFLTLHRAHCASLNMRWKSGRRPGDYRWFVLAVCIERPYLSPRCDRKFNWLRKVAEEMSDNLFQLALHSSIITKRCIRFTDKKLLNIRRLVIVYHVKNNSNDARNKFDMLMSACYSIEYL